MRRRKDNNDIDNAMACRESSLEAMIKKGLADLAFTSQPGDCGGTREQTTP